MWTFRRRAGEKFQARQVPHFDPKSSAVEYLEFGLALAEWCGGTSYLMDSDGNDQISVPTAIGPLAARPGDWILKWSNGTLSVCGDTIFREVYEPC